MLPFHSGFVGVGNHPIDQAVILGLFRTQEIVPVGVFFDFFKTLPCHIGHGAVEHFLHPQDFPGFDFDIARLSLRRSPQRLVDHDPAMRQGQALAFRACRQQKGTHRCGQPDADGDDVTLHVLHGVVDRQASGDRSTWGVDVQVDGLAAVFGIEIQHLGNEAVRNPVIHIRAEEQNPLNAKTGVDVDPALHLAAGEAVGNAGGTNRHGS
jgi:hypothetical protein